MPSADRQEAIEFPHVLDGVGFDRPCRGAGASAGQRLLDEAGWDPWRPDAVVCRPDHRLLGRKVCRVERCAGTAHDDYPDICHRCFTRLTRMGMTMAEIVATAELPAAPVPASQCAVPECRCVPTARGAVLCEPHAQNFRGRRIPVTVEEFVRHPRVRPHPPSPACSGPACTRTADGAIGYCGTHYQRWCMAQRTIPGIDEPFWRTRESGVAEPGQVNLRALPELVVVEVLIGLQTRLRDGLRLTDVVLRAVCDTLRRHQVVSIHDCDPKLAPGRRATSIMTSFARDARRMLADPGVEQAKDTWDLAIFGHPGEAVVHHDHPALAVRRCEAVGGRTTAASPRQRRCACSRQNQQHRVAVRTPRSPARPRPGSLRPWAPRPGRVPEPARPPGSHRPDRPLPTQHDLPRRSGDPT